jgi:hypothetical protein
MNAPISISEILTAEIHLIEGVNFELLYFHPYNAVMAFTEDLRTFLKSDIGCKLVSFGSNDDAPKDRLLAGEDLRPIHDEARRIVDDAVISDIPFLASPGQIGLSSLIVANEYMIEGKLIWEGDSSTELQRQRHVPCINFHEYIKCRFSRDHKQMDLDTVLAQVDAVCNMIRQLKDGKFGCGNHVEDFEDLKKIHKKLKSCRAWGGGPHIDEKKKKRKRE